MEQPVNFKSSEILISRIKESLSTYDSAGIIDVGKFYFLIKRELQLLGNYIYLDNQEVITLVNSKALLPEDFIKLYAVYNVSGIESKITYSGKQQDLVYQVNTTVKTLDGCEDQVALARTETFINTTLEQQFHNSTNLLKYSGRVNKELCEEDSPNFHSKNTQEFNIDKNYIYTNFKEGKVLLQYLAFPYDEDGYPMIPDEPKIEQAIESYIMYKMFEYFYLNDITNNAMQKMQYLEQKYKIDHKSALNFIKLPSYQDLVDAAYKNIKNRFKIFELKRNGRYSFNPSNRDAERSRQYSSNITRI